MEFTRLCMHYVLDSMKGQCNEFESISFFYKKLHSEGRVDYVRIIVISWEAWDTNDSLKSHLPHHLLMHDGNTVHHIYAHSPSLSPTHAFNCFIWWSRFLDGGLGTRSIHAICPVNYNSPGAILEYVDDNTMNSLVMTSQPSACATYVCISICVPSPPPFTCDSLNLEFSSPHHMP